MRIFAYRAVNGQSFTPIILTFTVSTIMPVNCSTLYLTDFFKDSATAEMETPNLIITNTSIKIRSPEVVTCTPLPPASFLKSCER